MQAGFESPWVLQYRGVSHWCTTHLRNQCMHCFGDLIYIVQIRTEKGIYILTELITGGQLYEQMRDAREVPGRCPSTVPH